MNNKIPGSDDIITLHQTMSHIPIEIFIELIHHNTIRQICKLFRDSDYINKRFITKNIGKYRQGETFKHEPFGAYAFVVRENGICVRYVAFGPTKGEYYSGEQDGCNGNQLRNEAFRNTDIISDCLHMLRETDNQNKTEEHFHNFFVGRYWAYPLSGFSGFHIQYDIQSIYKLSNQHWERYLDDHEHMQRFYNETLKNYLKSLLNPPSGSEENVYNYWRRTYYRMNMHVFGKNESDVELMHAEILNWIDVTQGEPDNAISF